MTRPDPTDAIGDDRLTAYLDGELPAAERASVAAALAEDAGLRRRLAELEAGGRPFGAALAPLLEAAPTQRLRTRLRDIPAMGPARDDARAGGRWRGRAAAAVAAALLAGFLVGVAADRLALAPGDEHAEDVERPEDWREAVAAYLELYTTKSFALMPDDPDLRAAQLAAVGTALDVELTPETVQLPGLQLRRAQLLEYDDSPLGQIAYLDAELGPVAFCMFRDGRPDESRATEERHGLNIVHWARGGVGYLVIGGAPVETLRDYADILAARF